MNMEPFQDSGHRAGVYFRNMSAQGLVLKSVDVELATGQDFKLFEIVVAKEIESSVGTVVDFYGFGDPFEVLDPSTSMAEKI